MLFAMDLNCVMTEEDLDASVCLSACVLLQTASRLHLELIYSSEALKFALMTGQETGLHCACKNR